jgi:3-isopropylmalate/(R)-2-methylmalate dehydratase small subunit
MEKFRVHTGIAIPLDRANVDTDQIIPKQFLKRVERTGFGQFLFYDWRFRPDGSPDQEFVLNDPRYAGASILIAGKNFGCGSSREHAPWALADYGFRAVVAPYFADIFAGNSAKNGIVLAALPEEQISRLLEAAKRNPGYRVTVDLERCEVRDEGGLVGRFEMDSFRRRCLLEGLDDIGLTMQQEHHIAAFEAKLS